MPTISELSGINSSSLKLVDGIDIDSIQSISGVDTAPATPLLLDTTYGSSAEVAYSVRKLRAAYKGSAMLVQRTVGSFAPQDIGFDIDGNLDTASLLTYASGNEVRIARWYDQSGNSNNAEQTTVNQRPIVVAAGGALVKIDGRSAMTLDGQDDGFEIGSNILGAYSIFTLGNPNGNDRYYQDSSFGGRQFVIRNSSVAGSFLTYQNGIVTSYLYEFAKELVDFISNSATTLYTNTLLMRFTNSGGYFGEFSEYIIYTTGKSTAERTDIESNIGDYYTQNTPLLDTYTGAAAAYSLRLLRTAYTGSAIQVQRADNVGGTTDIGFNCFGELDTVSLAKVAAGNSMVLTVWYDQSGNGNNASQGTSALRPKIYDGTTGVVTDDNGKAAIDFNGDALITPTVNMSTATCFIHHTNFDANARMFGQFDRFENNFFYDTVTGYWAFLGGSIQKTGLPSTLKKLVYTLLDSNGGELGINGDTATTGSLSVVGGDMDLQIGQRISSYWKGTASEFIVYDSDQSDNRTEIEDNINTFYDIF